VVDVVGSPEPLGPDGPVSVPVALVVGLTGGGVTTGGLATGGLVPVLTEGVTGVTGLTTGTDVDVDGEVVLSGDSPVLGGEASALQPNTNANAESEHTNEPEE
jgi:hypothetical protein